ncbi:molecular chaperone [Malassezia vespertilionis]|uniref:J domain-containing protein n=1 Tax=Malassezia vespertilionis TaxID=2020962 RepID=A0A2N1J8Y5_9BASI|nr:molecular chaperone [Malassezia vespertilionis]PKI83020.1 hypothetical protein MVES_002996 [Malassezia vespertilionis]WFD07786.1 molecular chaperone [Malassezia vespertilionis]
MHLSWAGRVVARAQPSALGARILVRHATNDALQRLPSDIDYYTLLDVQDTPNHGWTIDLAQLKGQWRKKQAQLHPDRLVSRPAAEQHLGAEQSALVNKAYETLRSPLLRATYLLQREGIDAVEEASSLEDPAFLMDVMELQEALEEADNQETVDQVGVAASGRMDAVLTGLEHAFAQEPRDLEQVKSLAVQLRYWTNIEKAVREWQG